MVGDGDAPLRPVEGQGLAGAGEVGVLLLAGRAPAEAGVADEAVGRRAELGGEVDPAPMVV